MQGRQGASTHELMEGTRALTWSTNTGLRIRGTSRRLGYTSAQAGHSFQPGLSTRMPAPQPNRLNRVLERQNRGPFERTGRLDPVKTSQVQGSRGTLLKGGSYLRLPNRIPLFYCSFQTNKWCYAHMDSPGGVYFSEEVGA
jgi:hypothetical protein